ALGELVARSELCDELPRDTGARGERDRGGDHPHASEAHTQAHLRNAAQVAFEVWGEYRFEHLAIAAPDHLAGQLEAELHPYLRERLSGRLTVPVTANHGEVLAAAEAVEARAAPEAVGAAVGRRRQAKLVDRLRMAVAAGRRGTAGLAEVVDPLNEHRVDVLLVSKGFAAPGWRCRGCDRLAAIGRRCR